MVANRKVTGTAASMPVGIGTGLAVSLAVTLAGAVAVTLLLNNGALAEENIGYGSMLILLLASAAGTMVGVGLVKHRRLTVCALCAVCYFASLLLLNMLFFGGQYAGTGVTALVIMAGCLGAALLSARGEGRSKKGRRKFRSG